MKVLHVLLRVFAKPEEDGELIKDALIGLIPFDINKEKILVEQTTAKGFEERKIKIFRIALTKRKHIQAFLDKLLNRLTPADRKLILNQKHSRLDEDLHFFLRLDKLALLKNIWKLTDRGDCFHIQLSLATYPKSRKQALQIIEKLFKVK